MEEGKRGRCEDGVAVSAKEGGNSEEVVFEDVGAQAKSPGINRALRQKPTYKK